MKKDLIITFANEHYEIKKINTYKNIILNYKREKHIPQVTFHIKHKILKDNIKMLIYN